jgi:hypothetical protein
VASIVDSIRRSSIGATAGNFPLHDQRSVHLETPVIAPGRE